MESSLIWFGLQQRKKFSIEIERSHEYSGKNDPQKTEIVSCLNESKSNRI